MAALCGRFIRLLLLARLVASQPEFATERSKVFAEYDRNTRPNLAAAIQAGDGASASADLVELQLYLSHIKELDQVDQAFTLEGYVRLWWADARLGFNKSLVPTDGWVAYPQDEQLALWLPDLYWENSTGVELGGLEGQLLWASPEGDVWWSRRGHITVRCDLDFHDIPFDVQRCQLRGGSYSKKASQVKFRWKIDSDGNPLPFDEGVASRGICSKHLDEWQVVLQGARSTQKSFASGSYSYADADFLLVRNPSAYTFRFIALPIVYVFFAWLSLFLSSAAGVDRIAITIVTILVTYENYTTLFARLPAGLAYSPHLATFVLGSFVFNIVAFCAACLENYGARCLDRLQKLLEQRTFERKNKLRLTGETRSFVLSHAKTADRAQAKGASSSTDTPASAPPGAPPVAQPQHAHLPTDPETAPGAAETAPARSPHPRDVKRPLSSVAPVQSGGLTKFAVDFASRFMDADKNKKSRDGDSGGGDSESFKFKVLLTDPFFRSRRMRVLRWQSRLGDIDWYMRWLLPALYAIFCGVMFGQFASAFDLRNEVRDGLESGKFVGLCT